MTAKEQLIPEIESLLEELISAFLDLICIKNRDRPQPETSATTNEKYWVRLVG